MSVTFIAHEIADNDQCQHFEADSWRDAVTICKREGWCLDGQVMAVIAAEEMTMQQADELIARRNAGIGSDA